jgi:hypothetical protein
MSFSYDAVSETLQVWCTSGDSDIVDNVTRYLDCVFMQVTKTGRQYYNPPVVNEIVIFGGTDFEAAAELVVLATVRGLSRVSISVYEVDPEVEETEVKDRPAQAELMNSLIALVRDNRHLTKLELDLWDEMYDTFNALWIDALAKSSLSVIMSMDGGLAYDDIITILEQNKQIKSLKLRNRSLLPNNVLPAIRNCWNLLSFSINEDPKLKKCRCGTYHAGGRGVWCDISAVLERNRQYQWKWVHQRVLNLAVALAPLRLPVYVALWIVDWIAPMSWRFRVGGRPDHDPQHLKKLRLLEGVAQSYERLRLSV